MEIKAGQILALTTGEYSDYCLRDHVRALRDFDTRKVKAAFKLQDMEPELERWSEETARFMAWIIKVGYVEPLEPGSVTEWYLGGYGLELKE